MYYLYKISVKGSPHYYIGITNDMSTRKWQHHGIIVKIIFCLINDTPILFSYIPAAKKFAELLYPLVRRFKHPEKEVKKHYCISVLRRCKNFEEIKAMETRYISKDDPNCLNVHKESRYYKEDMKEKPYIIRGNNKNQESCVVKITYGNRYVIAKFKTQSAGLKRIEDGLNSFIRGGTNNPNGLYYHFFNYIKRQPNHKFKVQTLLYSDDVYELLKKEQEELNKGMGNPKFLNNQTEAYIPAYNEETQMYGYWIPPIAVLHFKNWLKKNKPPKIKKIAV